jgi:hypothetical protein
MNHFFLRVNLYIASIRIPFFSFQATEVAQNDPLIKMKLDANKQAALDMHNQGTPPMIYPCPRSTNIVFCPAHREAPGARRPDLVWHEELASDVEALALQMAVTGEFAHAPQRENGENLACFEPAGERNYVAATQAWLDEKKNYHGQALTGEKVEVQDKMVGHYTALTWPELGGWEWDTLMSRKIASGLRQAGRMWLLGMM